MRQTLNILICFCTTIIIAQEVKVIHAEDFGITPNTFENIAPKLKILSQKISKYDAVKLEFLKGRYDIWPEHSEQREYFITNTSTEKEVPSKIKTIGLLFENAKNLTINGNGALFMIHGKMINFAFVDCQNIKLQNVSFDYERPTMSELTFKKVSENEVIASINPSSTYTIIDDKLVFYGNGWRMDRTHAVIIDTTLHAFYHSKFKPLAISKAKELAPFEILFKGDFSKSNYNLGQVLSIRDPYRDQVGAFIAYSKNVTLENVNMHYMHGMGIINQFNENVTLDNVIIKPRKSTGRKIAGFADGFHFSGCKGKIIIKNCKTYGGHDDPVNVHGTHLKVTDKISDTKIKLRFMHGQTYGLRAFFVGDTLEFVRAKSLQMYGRSQVKDVKAISEREVEITLNSPLPKEFRVGDVVENITWTPEVLIQNNYFSGTNTRGVLLTTRKKAVIENNTFYRTGMHAILIANDASNWYESGPVRDVTIRGNRFVDCAYQKYPDSYIIDIWPENHEVVKGFFVHENIKIENNIFETYDTPILRVKGTKDLVFRNNTIVKTQNFVERKKNHSSFYIQQSKNIKIELNKSDKDKFDSLKIVEMKKSKVQLRFKK